MKTLVSAVLLASAVAFAQPGPGPGRGPGHGPGHGPAHGPGMGMGMGMHHGVGIPGPIAQKLGINPDLVKKVRDLGFEANEQLIGLEADLKRAQLDLEKYLTGTSVEEGPALAKLDAVSKAETAVKKNRLGLMIKVRKTLGPDLWSKLQAEMPGPGGCMGPGECGGPGMGMGPGMHRGPMGPPGN